MAILDDSERAAVAAVAALLDTNPFAPQRADLEARALGDPAAGVRPGWHSGNDGNYTNPNTPRLRDRVERLHADIRRRLDAGVDIAADELEPLRGMQLYLLWLRWEDPLYELAVADEEAQNTNDPPEPVDFYPHFARDVDELLGPLPGPGIDAATLFAHGFQARRAFHHIFRKIFGGSTPVMELRAAAWTAIFSSAPLLARLELVDAIRNIPTLITGESGTGKDLVARAIGLSQFLPFDPESRRFAGYASQRWVAVNLAVFSPTVIESELFGHVRGAFTGADSDRVGWLETAGSQGAVFFDEIGDLDPTIQVKLLRVLQNRVFHRVGDTKPIAFGSKIVAATNRDLESDIEAGRFRLDFYRRICTHRIRTPSLREQFADTPDDLDTMLMVAAQRVIGPTHAADYAARARRFVVDRLGRDYPWQGNMRELEECVTSVFMNHEFVPTRPAKPNGDAAVSIDGHELTMKELTQRYARTVMERSSSLREAAQRLGIDRRALRRLLEEEEVDR